jgi:hypothetical protein
MDDNWATRRFIKTGCLISRPIFQIEAFRQLEVELNRCTLKRSTKSVTDGYVNFGTVEGTVPRIEVPLPRVPFVERITKLL